MRSHDLGKEGEAFAQEFLTAQGYAIRKTNYRTKFGEIDIVAEQGGCVCFIEVKTREKNGWDAFEAIDKKKQKKMIRVAQAYLLRYYETVDVLSRFDVLAVYEGAEGLLSGELLQNAFEC
ncbi:MAG: YraN family protein [Candidatus Omnitrophica bacterium]|nr:YraN family protein [Candidatus Omnitrophota bacterium]